MDEGRLPDVIIALEELLGPERVLHSPADLIAYSFDSTFAQHPPDVVVLPETNEEVIAVVELAADENMPVLARGMGSGLAGGTIAFQGGIVLSLTRMNRILEIDEENMTATVQAGIVTADLQAKVEKLGSSTLRTLPASSSRPSAGMWPATREGHAASSTASRVIT